MKNERDVVFESLNQTEKRYNDLNGFLKKWASPGLYKNESVANLLDGIEKTLIESHFALVKLKNFNNIAENE